MAESLRPGMARCPGPSARDVIRADNDGAPKVLREGAYEFLGDADLPFSRYTSQAFFDNEIERMWSRTWQWACREEHVPKPGDFYVYDVGPYSVIVVRHADGGIEAFVNSCPHRGMQFAAAGSSGRGKQFLRCPFHGMSWHLDGTLREIPCRWDFPHIDESAFCLDRVDTGTWGGFVFINLSGEAPPLEDYLGVLPEHFAHSPLENRFVSMHTQKVLPGNWKMCMEAFLEAYHVLATHPEGARYTGDANANYDVYGENVSRFMHVLGTPSPNLDKAFTEAEVFAAMGRDPADLPAGKTARQHAADLMRVEYGEAFGIDLSTASNAEVLDSVQYFLFPNAFFFPGILLRMVYRFRPLTVDTCIHEILVLDPLPKGKPRPPPAPVIHLDEVEKYESVPGFDFALVFDQDTENLRNQRAGMKASRKGAQTLGNYQEARIRHLHMTLDRYLER